MNEYFDDVLMESTYQLEAAEAEVEIAFSQLPLMCGRYEYYTEGAFVARIQSVISKIDLAIANFLVRLEQKREETRLRNIEEAARDIIANNPHLTKERFIITDWESVLKLDVEILKKLEEIDPNIDVDELWRQFEEEEDKILRMECDLSVVSAINEISKSGEKQAREIAQLQRQLAKEGIKTWSENSENITEAATDIFSNLKAKVKKSEKLQGLNAAADKMAVKSKEVAGKVKEKAIKAYEASRKAISAILKAFNRLLKNLLAKFKECVRVVKQFISKFGKLAKSKATAVGDAINARREKKREAQQALNEIDG